MSLQYPLSYSVFFFWIVYPSNPLAPTSLPFACWALGPFHVVSIFFPCSILLFTFKLVLCIDECWHEPGVLLKCVEGTTQTATLREIKEAEVSVLHSFWGDKRPVCLKMHQVVKTDLPLWASLRHQCFSQGIHTKSFSFFSILLPISLERECCFALLYFQMQIQLIPVTCKVSQDGTHCSLKPFGCPGSYSFK